MRKKLFIFLWAFAICTIALLHSQTLFAQGEALERHDTTYYVDFPGKVTFRGYLSQKYTDFTLKSDNDEQDLKYRPNTTLNLGVGITYHIISINIAIGFGFMNPDIGQGKTKYLDLQGHLYPAKWAIDWMGQFYKGYYLSPKGFAAASPTSFYQRPDMDVTLLGISAYRIFNHKKFSYRAAFVQNEWQKKSAGTFLLGGEINYGVVEADSAFVPRQLRSEYPQGGINNVNFFSFGPGIGYAYTLVVKKHFFATGSLNVNLNLGFANEYGYFKYGYKAYVNPFSVFRMAVGYNSDRWNVSANWVGNRLPIQGGEPADNYSLNTGNYRFVIAKKIVPRKKFQKGLTEIDKLYRYKDKL